MIQICEGGDWYVVATKPARESVAACQLRNQAFDAFLPMRRATTRKAKKLLTKPKPLFPGYVFVRMRPDSVRWRAINGTLGVKYILAQDDRPIPLPRGFVEAILDRTGVDGAVSYGPQLKIGDKVSVMAGPFANEVGELMAMDARGRVEVLMRFASSMAVKTTRDNLLPA